VPKAKKGFSKRAYEALCGSWWAVREFFKRPKTVEEDRDKPIPTGGPVGKWFTVGDEFLRRSGRPVGIGFRPKRSK